MLVKVYLDSREIDFLIISKETGKIKSSGDINPDTWEDTYVDLSSVVVGKELVISFNKAFRTRHKNNEPVWTPLIYKITLIEEVKDGEPV